MSRRQRCRSEAYRTRRFIRRHPDLVASAVEAASLSALADVVSPFIGRAAAERLVREEVNRPIAQPTPAAEIRERIDLMRNVTGHTLKSAGLDNLEFRGPAGEREPLIGLVVKHGQTVEDALREAVAARGEGWSIWFVTPGERAGAS